MDRAPLILQAAVLPVTDIVGVATRLNEVTGARSRLKIDARRLAAARQILNNVGTSRNISSKRRKRWLNDPLTIRFSPARNSRGWCAAPFNGGVLAAMVVQRCNREL
jgi:hypothetical protein